MIATERVQLALSERGIAARVQTLPGSTRTAAEAAEALGCSVEQIAKSLIFKGKESGAPLLAIASGANRVDVKKLERLAGEAIGKADAEFVRRETGFAIGGVPPLGHEPPVRTWLDECLLRFEVVWAAAGTPHSVFPVSPDELLRATGAIVADIAAP